jgi:hypothetical protein
MAERYRDDLLADEKRGWRLSERIKAISKGQGIDCRQAFCRFTVESILWALQETSEYDFVIKGGLLHDQRDRQTDDADIMFFTRRDPYDVFKDCERAAAHLRPHGIFWQPVEFLNLDMDGRHGCRIPVQAKVGPTLPKTHLDIGFGPLPEGATRREFRSMFKGPSFTAWAQPIEAQAADKLAAVITIGMTNTRMKDFADLQRMWKMGLDNRLVARALYRTMLERKADPSILLSLDKIDGLNIEFVDAHKWMWRDHAAKDGDLSMEFLDVVCDIRHWYGDIKEQLVELASRGQLEPRSHLRAPSVELSEDNVVDLASWRGMRA